MELRSFKVRSSWIRVALNPVTGIPTEKKPHEDGGRGWRDMASGQGHLVPQELGKPGRISAAAPLASRGGMAPRHCHL